MTGVYNQRGKERRGFIVAQTVPENMSSLNSLQPFSKFSTRIQVRDAVYVSRAR